MEYQVTLLCATNQYKPMSCIVKKKQCVNLKDKVAKRSVINDGIVKICKQKGWSQKELKKYSYTKVKIREYDKKIIEQEKAENYQLLKAMKYVTGEWQKPNNAEM